MILVLDLDNPIERPMQATNHMTLFCT